MQQRFFLFIFLLISYASQSQQSFPATRVVYDSPWIFNNLKLIPIRYTNNDRPATPYDKKIISLQSAINTKKIKISELPGATNADRRVLVMVNTGKDEILVNSGEIVSGGKQDRIIANSFVIKPGKEKNYADVFCVEKNRWQKRPKNFKYTRPADMALRKAMDIHQLQSAIWKEIDKQYKDRDTTSETWDYKELYTAKRFLEEDTSYIKYFTTKFAASDSNYAGFIAVTGNKIIGAELYAEARFVNTIFISMMRSYAATAILTGDDPVVPNSKVAAFINPVLNDKTRDEYLKGRGKAYTVNKKIIHIVVHGDE